MMTVPAPAPPLAGSQSNGDLVVVDQLVKRYPKLPFNGVRVRQGPHRSRFRARRLRRAAAAGDHRADRRRDRPPGTALPLVIDFSFTKEIEDRLLAPLPVGFVALEKILFGTLRALIAGAIMFPIGRLVLGTLPFQASRTWLLIAFLLLGAVMGSGLGMTLGTLVLTPLLFTGVHPIPVAVTVEPPVVPGAHAREPADLRERGRARLDGAPGAAHARLDRGHRADLCHGRAGRGWRHGVHAPCDRLDRLGAGLVDKRNRTCGRYGLLLESKNAVIYGGGGAIGAAVARAFAREGAKVHLAGRTLERLEAVAGTIRSAGGVTSTARVDALDERAVDEHADAVAADAA